MRRLKCDDLLTSFHMTTDGQTPVQSDNKSFRERQVRARSARSNLLERYLARKGDRKNLVVSAAKEEKFLLTPSNRRCQIVTFADGSMMPRSIQTAKNIRPNTSTPQKPRRRDPVINEQNITFILPTDQ